MKIRFLYRKVSQQVLFKIKEEALNDDMLAPKAAAGPGKAEKKQVSSVAPLDVRLRVCMHMLYCSACFCISANASISTDRYIFGCSCHPHLS